MSARELLKRAKQLEDHFGSGDDDEVDVDWERLSKEEQDILIAGARIDLKYRRKGPGPHGFIYSVEEATAEEKSLRKEAQAILEKHLEKKSEIKKRYLSPF